MKKQKCQHHLISFRASSDGIGWIACGSCYKRLTRKVKAKIGVGEHFGELTFRREDYLSFFRENVSPLFSSFVIPMHSSILNIPVKENPSS